MDEPLVPLYSDEKIERAVGAVDFRNYEDELAEELMRAMRDDYERDRNFWAVERATLTAQLAEEATNTPSDEVQSAIAMLVLHAQHGRFAPEDILPCADIAGDWLAAQGTGGEGDDG